MSIIQGQKEIEVQTTSQITKEENSPGIEKYFLLLFILLYFLKREYYVSFAIDIISELVMDRVLEI